MNEETIEGADRYLLEIATNDFETTKSAVAGGGDRIELCAGLSEGGITPSYGMIRWCRESFGVPLFPIVRPRGGDFLYTEEEFDVMLEDVVFCKQADCDGVVIGLLNRDGSVDKERTSRLVQAAYPLDVTFHRAFDRCRDPFEALEQLIEIGCSRILTSGQQPTAPEGAALIVELVKAAGNRIVIMPGSGVRKENIKALAVQTGAFEFHSSLRGKAGSKMEFVHPAFAGSSESYSNAAISEAEVQALKQSLK